MAHEKLLEKAKEAIKAVFEDKSVSREKCLDSLDELASDCDMFMDALRSDADREERN